MRTPRLAPLVQSLSLPPPPPGLDLNLWSNLWSTSNKLVASYIARLYANQCDATITYIHTYIHHTYIHTYIHTHTASEDLEYWCDNRIPNQTYQYPSGLTNSQFTDYSVETLATTTEADNNNSQFTDYSAETLATTTEAAGSPSLYQLTWPALLLSLIVMLSQ